MSLDHLDVVALGGNALLPSEGKGTIGEQFAVTRTTMFAVAELVASGRTVVLTHGNGPVVGNILMRNEHARELVAPMPLGICVADSQGGMGYMIQQVLRNALMARGIDREVVTVVTQIRVAADDPALDTPSKPVGPFFNEADAKDRQAEGWVMAEDSRKRGFRRLVPSPRPVDIVELETIRRLVDTGAIVIAVGGGGIPVIDADGQLEGVEAVVDKDFASSVLAWHLRAERFIIVTEIDAVYESFGTPEQRALRHMASHAALAMSEQLPDGSMGPKLESAARFAATTGRPAYITATDNILTTLAGETGTRIADE